MSSLPHSVKRWLGLEAPQAPPAVPSGAGLLRHSNGLREFFNQLQDQKGLRVLDLGPASQATINLITGLGHKIYHEDVYPELAEYAYRVRLEGGGTRWDDAAFLLSNLDYSTALFDGLLCWDMLDLLPDPAAVHAIVARLHHITKPGGALLMFFHTAEPGSRAPVSRCQIHGCDSLEMFPRGEFTLKRPLNNRNIEKLFREFHSLKFFLARDNLREVLVLR